MNNNDILSRLRYLLNCNDAKMQDIFLLGGAEVSRELIKAYLSKEGTSGYVACKDADLARFLNGLIIEKRGKKEGAEPKIEAHLTNNQILIKLKIAFNLQAEIILELLEKVGLVLSSHELSSFFRKPGHRNYRECQDQVLRNFLSALLLHQNRPESVWEKGAAKAIEASEAP